MSMIVILPNEIDGLAGLEVNLSGSVLDEMDKIASQKTVNVVIPKFHIETSVNLKDSLAEMGVKEIFSSGLPTRLGILRGSMARIRSPNPTFRTKIIILIL